MMRRYSEHEIDEAVSADQERRHAAEMADRASHPDRWEEYADEFSDVFGPTWREIKRVEN